MKHAKRIAALEAARRVRLGHRVYFTNDALEAAGLYLSTTGEHVNYRDTSAAAGGHSADELPDEARRRLVTRQDVDAAEHAGYSVLIIRHVDNGRWPA